MNGKGVIFRPAREVQERPMLSFVDEPEREKRNYMLKVDKSIQIIEIVLFFCKSKRSRYI